MAEEAQPKKGYGKGSSKRRFINVREIAYATERLGGLSIQDAAVAAGYKASYGPDLEAKPLIQKFIQDYNTRIQEELAKKEVPRLARAAMSRAAIIERLAVLSYMEPETTNGNITGQVRALAELAEIFQMKINLTADLTRELAGRSTEDLEHLAQFGTYRDGSRPSALASAHLGASGSGTAKVN